MKKLPILAFKKSITIKISTIPFWITMMNLRTIFVSMAEISLMNQISLMFGNLHIKTLSVLNTSITSGSAVLFTPSNPNGPLTIPSKRVLSPHFSEVNMLSVDILQVKKDVLLVSSVKVLALLELSLLKLNPDLMVPDVLLDTISI